MTKLLLTLALVVSFVGAASAAPRGLPYAPRKTSLTELTSWMEKSIGKSDDGSVPICDGCASPAVFLETLKLQGHRQVPSAARDFPAYMKTELVERPLTGSFWLACRERTTLRPIPHCNWRHAEKGEMGAYDRVTGRLVFRLGCSNPAEKELEEKCARIRYETRFTSALTSEQDRAVRFTYCAPEKIVSDCWGVQQAGQDAVERVWEDKCHSAYCTFVEFARAYKLKCWTVGSHEVTESGYNYLYVPGFFAEKFADDKSADRAALCLDRGGRHSDSIGVQWFDYVYRSPAGEKEARVEYSASEVPQGMPRVYWPFGEWHGR